ncbi:MAG TPA: MlaD family protein [Lacipirellulaceae bacterium]|nr:MlaD family protein [Lacipirellulaceae bacterium]
MNERQMQFRVGVVVFATMIVGGLLASLNAPLPMGWLPWGHAKYQIGIEVPQAPGVDTNTPVRKNGILIGRVKSIEDKDGGVLLKADIDGNRPLFTDFEAHIRTTVLGDATIDFLSKRPAPGAQPVASGTIFQGHVDPNPFDSLGQLGDLKNEFSAASRSLAQAGDEVSKLAGKVNSALGDDGGPESQGRVKRLLDTTEHAMNQFAITMQSLNDIIGDEPTGVPGPGGAPSSGQPPYRTQFPPNATQPPGVQLPGAQPPASGPQMRMRLRQGLDELPDAIHDFRATMNDSRVVMQSAERNFKNLESFTNALGDRGPEVANALLRAVQNVDALVKDLGDVARALNNRTGSFGKFVNDPQFYDNLNVLMFNANKVLGSIDEITMYLKPVLVNARIFLDKVATEPGRLISGAVNPSNVK